MLARLHAADRQLFTRIFRQSERKAIIPLARALSRSGDGYLYALIPLTLWALNIPKSGLLVIALALGFTLERILYGILKRTLKRRRPANAIPGFNSLIIASDKFSFPSGHASGAFLFATSMTFTFGAPLLAIYLWASGVALSRVLLGVHFPGDIVAGSFLGASIGLICIALLGSAW
ncbi:MAG: phosphatase PAP2 family protein [Pseudomonadota bacterium]